MIDRAKIETAAGVRFYDVDVERMSGAFDHYKHTEYLENADGAFSKCAELRDSLNKIEKLTSKLEDELSRDDPSGHMAAFLSGGLDQLHTIKNIRHNAEQQAKTARLASLANRGNSTPMTADARRTFVLMCLQAWKGAGGRGRGDYIGANGCGPLIRLVLTICADMPAPPSEKTIQRDIDSLSEYLKVYSR